MPKNYYIYYFMGKIRRQAINLNDVYPESYALLKIPQSAEIIAKIFSKKSGKKSCWQKHALFTPEQSFDEWKKIQQEWKEKFKKLLLPDEVSILKN